MAKSKFDKVGDNKATERLKEATGSLEVIYLQDGELFDHPKNQEDVEFTEDLEKSILENGFTDPIEVTLSDCGNGKGKYTILSGHRRTMAVRRLEEKGTRIFPIPSIVRDFKTPDDAYNYLLFSNAQRDSEKDATLFARRFIAHKAYLDQIHFVGDKVNEIAARLGVSREQAKRYSTFSKCIDIVWDMVNAGKVSMSSIVPIGKYSNSDQREICGMLEALLDEGTALTRETCKKVFTAFDAGSEVTIDELAGGKAVIGNNIDVTEKQSTKETTDNYDSHKVIHPSQVDDTKEMDESLNEKEDPETVYEPEENGSNENDGGISRKVHESTHITEANARRRGEDMIRRIQSLIALMANTYSFENKGAASDAMNGIASMILIMFEEMIDMSNKYDLVNDRQKKLKEISEHLNNIMK